MKIKIIEGNEPIRVYHDTKSIRYNRIKNIITVGRFMDKQVFNVIGEPKLTFLGQNPENDEIYLEFKVFRNENAKEVYKQDMAELYD